jgi:hypothetical protein
VSGKASHLPGVDVEPLHGIRLQPGQWWGCEFPERPHTDDECWDQRCPRCRIRMALVLQLHGDIELKETHDGSPRGDTISQVLDLMADG